MLTRIGGEPVGYDEAHEVRGLVEALDVVDARLARALAVVARAVAASLMPFPFVAPKAPRVAAPKRTAKRATAIAMRRRPRR